MEKIFTALALLTFVAMPASAQSFCTCDGTGNVLKFTNNSVTYQNSAPSIPTTSTSGLHAFAMDAKRLQPRFDAADPANVGGGSLGYNEMLREY